MQKIYFFVISAFFTFLIFPDILEAQNCNGLTASTIAYESRCAATGSIRILATGGSGSYKYKVSGPVTINFTTSDSITGLGSGSYTVTITDIVTNCTINQNNVFVPGTYQDPRFTLNNIDISCDNGNNGSIQVTGQQFGRPPFIYSIVAPSPAGIGTTNSTGIFNNLVSGDYSIRLTDSCGGIQTRTVTLNNYTWWLDSYDFSKISCDSAKGYIKVKDSRGNISTVNGLPGFMYGVVRSPGDTVWSSNAFITFYLAGNGAVSIIAKDSCGNIKKGNTTLNFNPSVGAGANVFNKTCSTFTVSFINTTNFFNPDYCLYDNNNVQISCNNTGTFTNVPYGQYCIKAHNACPDTIITRCINVLPPPLSVSNNVLVTSKNCTSFTASITGQSGLTNPDYCLYDGTNTLVTCNKTGVFTSLPYGNYCINVDDNCRDTVITRCFTISKPTPTLPTSINPGYITCTNFGVVINGDSLYQPQYCLKDAAGNVLTCNNTGVFDSLAFGSYCVSVYDSCYDTTIIRCFDGGAQQIINDINVSYSNKTCSTLTVQATSNNVNNPQYCLYTISDSLIACNTSGTFNSLAYGAYCVKVQSVCPDTLFTNCFSVSPPVPSVGTSVILLKKTCFTFTAKISGQKNLTNPQYCLYDATNVLMVCNTTGTFPNLPYGSYCIEIVNTCYDTTLRRCFTASPVPVKLAVTSSKSCSYGFAKLSVIISGGTLPVNIKIYNTDGSIRYNQNNNSSSFTIDSIPGQAVGETYKVVATDNCGNKDSIDVSVTPSIATHIAEAYGECPSAQWQNGGGRIEATTTTNMGVYTVKVIKKNGVSLSPQLAPNSASGGFYKFDDLEAATYIVRYKLNDICNTYFYDTVTIKPYTYPNLSRSSAYQCDVSGFSVGAVASNGVGPFSYEIIGSTPSSPSIATPAQPNPIFNINNGTNYSLIRLRALDACGNATLADASILPLANYKIIVDSNCFQSSSTLKVDTIYNATYSWYKKDNYNSVDSTYLGSGYSMHIPYVSANDTGVYVCQVIVNTGCVKRTYMYNLNGLCYSFLPAVLQDFSGKFVSEDVVLSWIGTQENSLQEYIIERRNNISGSFDALGKTVPVKAISGAINHYEFRDGNPQSGNNFYRLRLVNTNFSENYSKVVLLNKSAEKSVLKVFPNPAIDKFTIGINGNTNHNYKVRLLNMVNQPIIETSIPAGVIRIEWARNSSIPNGIYIVECTDLVNFRVYTQKLILK